MNADSSNTWHKFWKVSLVKDNEIINTKKYIILLYRQSNYGQNNGFVLASVLSLKIP